MRVFDIRRFTRHQNERGATAGWRFEAGWFRYMSGFEWAWFSRDAEEREDHGSNERID